MQRMAAILCPLSALPSRYGMGTMGAEAFRFVDFLAAAGCGWQLLPVNPTDFGNSPYQSVSTHAGNPHWIDLDALIAQRLLTAAECAAIDWGSDPTRIDYPKVAAGRERLLRLAYARLDGGKKQQLAAFTAATPWLAEVATFLAIREMQDGKPFWEWQPALSEKQPAAVAEFSFAHTAEIGYHAFCQWLFATQFSALRAYAKEKGVIMIGDLPIYVSADSADVWANRRCFQLDATGRPTRVAGVPPDAFSEEGQRWGNPLYDWNAIIADNWNWWIDRVRTVLARFDWVRLDHFRGFESFWSIAAEAPTAIEGRWEPGPGRALFDTLRFVFGELPFLAEDLGVLTPAVEQLLRDTGFPGMKVLQFAFTPHANSSYLPHHHISHAVCYTGTHDNETIAGWLKGCSAAERAFVNDYLDLPSDDAVWGIIRAAWRSPAFLAVTTVQDVLELPNTARCNAPGTVSAQNWSWRLSAGALTAVHAARLQTLGVLFDRCPDR